MPPSETAPVTIALGFFDVGAGSPEDPTAFRVTLPAGITMKSELMEALQGALKLPEYFGRNWNALWDVLCDLSWIQARRVILVHPDVPGLADPELRTYIRLLNDSVRDWELRPGDHELEVLFPVQVRARVVALLGATE